MRVGHAADHRAGPDNRTLFDYVRKAARLGTNHALSLGPTLDLGGPDGICLAEHLIDRGIFDVNRFQAERHATLALQRLGLLNRMAKAPGNSIGLALDGVRAIGITPG